MTIQKCTRCIMDNASDPTISFDKEGHCNYCSGVLRRMPTEYFPGEDGREKLDRIVKEMKDACKDDPYDCIVGLSGGIDSSYILYLGSQYGLRMLAVHVDDGLDNPIAVENIKKLEEKTNIQLAVIRPDRAEYTDLLKSLFKASISNLAIVQDNLILKSLQDYGEKNKIRYILDGANFAHESILERSTGIDACDRKFILGIHDRFGEVPLKKTEFFSLTDRYLKRRYRSSLIHVRPLNYISYNLENAIQTLEEFCGFQYYGGKHYESILTRFLQCYYLPEKFGVDKRKSHYSSLIMSGQMTREEALEKMKMPLYPSEDLLRQDEELLADYMNISVETLKQYIEQPPKPDNSYPHSFLNELAPVARKFRRFLE